MVSASTKLALFSQRHPLALGIVSYATLWPTSSIIQQTIAGKNITNYDWMKAARFSVFGGLFSAPTLYLWLRFNRKIVPARNLKTSILKAIIEQMTYGPAHLACFFFGMSILEGKKIEQAKNEVQAKFVPTWKIGVCFWPIISTVNHTFVKERYKVPFASLCSLVWCCFLAYMQQLNQEQIHKRNLVAVQKS